MWLEGGDATANTFNSFLSSNRSAIETWVSSGGRLILNAAPNEGGNINYGFGGITLNFSPPTYSSASSDVHAVDSTNPVFNGPNGATGTSFSGNSFSHAYVTGGGLASIIDDDQNRSVLGNVTYGGGLVLAGGMTTDNFHYPSPGAQNLSSNILNYADTQAVVPEPCSVALLAAGLVGTGVAAYRRRKSAGPPDSRADRSPIRSPRIGIRSAVRQAAAHRRIGVSAVGPPP